MYCKCSIALLNKLIELVLIVAKCIVNTIFSVVVASFQPVLIVAKCIVNTIMDSMFIGTVGCINSSKVYCKFKSEYTGQNRRNVLIVAKCIVN